MNKTSEELSRKDYCTSCFECFLGIYRAAASTFQVLFLLIPGF